MLAKCVGELAGVLLRTIGAQDRARRFGIIGPGRRIQKGASTPGILIGIPHASTHSVLPFAHRSVIVWLMREDRPEQFRHPHKHPHNLSFRPRYSRDFMLGQKWPGVSRRHCKRLKVNDLMNMPDRARSPLTSETRELITQRSVVQIHPPQPRFLPDQ